MERANAGRRRVLALVGAAALAVVSCGPPSGTGTGGGAGTGGGTGAGGGGGVDFDGGSTWTATLTGAQETPPVDTAASGSAAFVLDAAETTLGYTITQSVAGATAAHLHTGYAGEAGPVTIPLASLSASMTGQLAITAEQVADLKAGRLYVNFHSPSHPGGEIRGQLLAQGAQLFVAPLVGDEEVPRVASTATGFASAILAPDRATLRYRMSTTAPVTASHFHAGLAGANGAVVVPFALDGGTATGQAAASAQLAADLEHGRLYANVHTAAHPGGELRGQLRRPGEQVFTAHLTGDQEVPAVSSTGAGTVQVLLDATVPSLRYEGTTTLTASAAHLHLAPGGSSGPVSVPFDLSLSGTASLSAAQLAALTGGGLYANVHTTAHPGGELRGQVLRPGERLFTAVLAGAEEVPPTASTATGGVQAVLSPAQDHLACAGAFSGLTATASHFHLGAAGATGPVKVPLTIDGGTLSCDTAISAGDVADLADGGWYANVHTQANPGGEIRGQLTPR